MNHSRAVLPAVVAVALTMLAGCLVQEARAAERHVTFGHSARGGGASPSSGYYPGPHPFSEPESRAVNVARSGPGLKRPPIHRDPIPYGHDRKRQMAAYSKRHYGRRDWRLRDPKVIVLHYTAGPSYRSAWQAFASNAPNMGELPGTCSHFIVAKRGRIHRTVRPTVRCRHAIGLNYTAIGVEMVQEEGSGSPWADRQILHRGPQIHRALRLVGWLKQRYGIKMRDIIGHAMANDSPYFKDLEGWRNDHTDWLRSDVKKFRHRLRRMLHRE